MKRLKARGFQLEYVCIQYSPISRAGVYAPLNLPLSVIAEAIWFSPYLCVNMKRYLLRWCDQEYTRRCSQRCRTVDGDEAITGRLIIAATHTPWFVRGYTAPEVRKLVRKTYPTIRWGVAL